MKHDFVLTIDDGIISSSLVELLVADLNFPETLFKQRKTYYEYYHAVKEYGCSLSFDDIDQLACMGRIEWSADFNLTLVI